ncbi:MAG: hypothetical protein CHACPFDD_03942 [Phycisphaerae bacterium]|nr:hypothetical protein [Phycisphaerae bacterium]
MTSAASTQQLSVTVALNVTLRSQAALTAPPTMSQTMDGGVVSLTVTLDEQLTLCRPSETSSVTEQVPQPGSNVSVGVELLALSNDAPGQSDVQW